jgi:hypothetical protein
MTTAPIQGHRIRDAAGNLLPQRKGAQFFGSGVQVRDNTVTGRTEIIISGSSTLDVANQTGATAAADQEPYIQALIDSFPGSVITSSIQVNLGKPLFAQSNTDLENIIYNILGTYSPAGAYALSYHLTPPLNVSAASGSQNITVNAAIGTLTAGVGALVAFKGTLPTGLNPAQEYYVTSVGSNFITVSATLGGTNITMGSNAASFTMYHNIFGMSRGVLRNSSFLLNNLAGGLRATLQQNTETSRLTFRDPIASAYGAYIDGQISTHYNWRFDFHSDNQRGLMFAGHGHNWFHLDFTRSGGLNITGMQPAGARNCAFYSAWGEHCTGGLLRFDASHPGYGISIYDPQAEQTDTPTVVVAAGTDINGNGYQIHNGRYGGSNAVIVDDQVRNFQLSGGTLPG